ncbi:ABC transporter ATP-binding protein [Natronoglycomyces albus]|uniref:ABC transporter ATP-binding protein n=1 Tax=Natronoglycomyces albus TaxID=2811108 RepID=A0A895XFH1_9ACTN|nr:ABC transporter ATP-binding protein [Natronoglycomyces albus]QSB04074.1 ABC transporter ATP-binding protein [Natronoglycomyces albus]
MSARLEETPAKLRQLWFYAREHKRLLVAGSILSLAGGTIALSQPLIAAALIESLQDGAVSTVALAWLAAVLIAGAVISAAGYYLIDRAGQNLVRGVRQRLLTTLSGLRVPAADTLKPGDVVSRLTADTTLLRTVATAAISNLVTHGLLLAVGLGLLAWFNWRLFVITAAMVGFVALMMKLVLPRVGAAFEQSQAALGDLGAAVERMLSNLRTIKANGAEPMERQRFSDINARTWRFGVRAVAWQASTTVLTWAPLNLAYLAVLALGGAQVATGAMRIGELIGFMLLLVYLMHPIDMLTSAATQLQTGLAAMRRIEATHSLPVEQFEAPSTTLPTSSRAATVELRDVWFAYDSNLPAVHKGVSFSCTGPGLTALVGPSGSGKTTVFSLIERFYSPDRGTVRIDGVDVAQWPLAGLRGTIGYVEQDAPVLAGSLRDNLLLGAPHASAEELWRALEEARLGEMVANLPEGVDTQVGHRGVALSGGERQRVAIARALLRSPRLLLLDEVTSQLDATNEGKLREVIQSVAKTTTVIAIAHRLSTVVAAKQIVVMDAGEIQAVGTHAELMRSVPMYADLAASQLVTA